MYGGGPVATGSHEPLIWIGILIVLLIVAHGAAVLIQRKPINFGTFAFGALNLVLVILAFRTLGLGWAIFHPTSDLAASINAGTRDINGRFNVEFTTWPDETGDMPRYHAASWSCTERVEGVCVFENAELGLTAQKRTIGQCYSAELSRLNWVAIFDRTYPVVPPNSDIGWVYFDSEGRWIRPPSWLHSETSFLESQLSDAQLRPSDLDYFDTMDRLWDQYERKSAADEESLSPYTREEIELLVARNWGEDEPSWWPDD